jgi:hypothetical protein
VVDERHYSQVLREKPRHTAVEGADEITSLSETAKIHAWAIIPLLQLLLCLNSTEPLHAVIGGGHWIGAQRAPLI